MKTVTNTILLIVLPMALSLTSCTPIDGVTSTTTPSTMEEKPATGPVPLKVINDCITALEKQIPDRDIMLISAKRGETSFIVDLMVRGVEKPWRCYHDGTRCTGTEYQGEG